MIKISVFKSGFIYLLSDVISLGFSSFLLIPIYTTYLEPDDYGAFGLVNFYFSFIGVFLMLGYHSVLTRFFYDYNKKTIKPFLSSIWFFQTIFSLFFIAIIWFFSQEIETLFSLGNIFRQFLFFIVVNSFLLFNSGILSVWLRINDKPFKLLYLQLSYVLVLSLMVYLLLVAYDLKLLGLLYSITISNVFMFLVSIIGLKKHLVFHFDLKYIKQTIKYGFWIVVGTLASIILHKSQLVYVENYVSLDSVGIMNLSIQVAGIITIFSVAFGKAWQPYVFTSKNVVEASRKIKDSFLQYSSVIFFISLIVIFFANDIITFIAPDYSDSVNYIKLFTIIIAFSSINLIPSSFLLFNKKASYTQIPQILSGFTCLLLNIILINKFQLAGAVISFAISSFLNLIVQFAVSQKVFKIDFDYFSFLKLSLIYSSIILLSFYWDNYEIGLSMTIIKILFLLIFITMVLLLNILDFKNLIKQINT